VPSSTSRLPKKLPEKRVCPARSGWKMMTPVPRVAKARPIFSFLVRCSLRKINPAAATKMGEIAFMTAPSTEVVRSRPQKSRVSWTVEPRMPLTTNQNQLDAERWPKTCRLLGSRYSRTGIIMMADIRKR